MAVSIENEEKMVELPAIILGKTSTSDLTSYMAPEILKREKLIQGCESKIDYFSLGCVLLEMCSGRRPSTKHNLSQAGPKLPWLINKDLKTLIQGLMNPYPLDRYGFERVTISPWLFDVSELFYTSANFNNKI